MIEVDVLGGRRRRWRGRGIREGSERSERREEGP